MSARDAGTPSAILHDWRQLRTKDVINVPCDGCTACCRSDMRVNLSEDETERFPHVIEDGRPVLAKNGRDCVMFDVENNRCSVYEDRPIVCKTYDCRQLWMAGFRNLNRGIEMNERLDEWRTQVHNDLDIGVVAMMWHTARQFVKEGNVDIAMAAAMGAVRVMCASDKALRSWGRAARRGGIEHVLKVLNRPNKVDR